MKKIVLSFLLCFLCLGVCLGVTNTKDKKEVVNAAGVTLEMNDEVLTLKKGETAFIPACDGSYKLSGSSEIIIAYV